MTTIFERCRALRWGAAILSELMVNPSAPADLVQRACELVPALPDQSVIFALCDGPAIELSPTQVAAINGTRDVLERLRKAGVAWGGAALAANC